MNLENPLVLNVSSRWRERGRGVIIIGIDPGSRFAGFGVIESDQGRWRHLQHGVITLNERQPLAERLAALARELAPLWGRWPNATTVVERIFFGKNAASAFTLGHARGVCLAAAAAAGSAVVEYAARVVKKTVVGHGNADKEQVRLMVRQILRLNELPAFDASDALALALCHAQHEGVLAVESRLREMER